MKLIKNSIFLKQIIVKLPHRTVNLDDQHPQQETIQLHDILATVIFQ